MITTTTTKKEDYEQCFIQRDSATPPDIDFILLKFTVLAFKTMNLPSRKKKHGLRDYNTLQHIHYIHDNKQTQKYTVHLQ